MPRRAWVAVTVSVVAVLIAALGLGGGAAADDNGNGNGRHLSARLTGEKEVPGPGDPDGSGSARIEVFPQRGTVCFELEWSKIGPPTAAHIHFGDPGVAGPIVVGLFMTGTALDQPPTLPDTIHSVGGCTDEVVVPEGAPFDSPHDLLRNIKRNPGDYYVNIHNIAFPAGAIRGQLHRAS
jgi:hypothetical protein